MPVANHSRAGCIQSMAAPAATKDAAKPPAVRPVTKSGTARMEIARRAEVSGLRTNQPRIAVAVAQSAAMTPET